MRRGIYLLMFVLFILPPCLGDDTFAPSAWAETGETEPLSPKPVHQNNEASELEKLRGDVQRWFDVQKEKRAHQFHDILELKIFQTHVFFGTGMAIFLVLALLFISKFLFNIVRDVWVAFYERVLSLMGYDTAKVSEHHFAPLMAQNGSENNKSVPAKAGRTKQFLFCDVMIQFVNPLIKPEFVHRALTEQNERNPRPRIGSLLIEYQVASQQDVDKTLQVQNKYRSQK